MKRWMIYLKRGLILFLILLLFGVWFYSTFENASFYFKLGVKILLLPICVFLTYIFYNKDDGMYG